MGYFRQNIGDYLKNHIVTYFFIILLFIIGIVVGALAVKTLPEEQKLELIGYLKLFFSGLTQNNNLDTNSHLLGSVVLNNVKTVLLVWFLGFTIIGIPFVLFIIFTRGFIIGFTVGFLVNEYVLKGVFFALVSVLPHNFFSIPALLTLGVSSISFSLMLVRRKNHINQNLWYNAVQYTLFCTLILIIMVAAAFIEVYISPVFMKQVAGLLLR